MAEARDIKFGADAQDKIIGGISTAARAVKSTLGPRGRNVIIQTKSGYVFTKDGITVCKNVFLKDKFENLGAQIAKEAGNLSVNSAGDGTTSTIALLEAVLLEGKKMIGNGLDPMSIRRGIDLAAKEVVKFIRSNAVPASGVEDLRRVATISANGDSTIGDLIASTLDKVGHDATVTLEEGKSSETKVVFSQGFEFDRGYLSPYFCNDPNKQRVIYDDAHVWLINGKLTGSGVLQQVMPVLEYCSQNSIKLLIIAENVENEVLQTLAFNAARGLLTVCAVKAAGFGDSRREMLTDLAAATGATIRRTEMGEDMFKDFSVSEFGKAKRVEVYKDKTVIISQDDMAESIEARVTEIETELAQTEDQDAKERLRKRRSILAGGIANIVVGGASDAEIREKRDLFEDALLAARCAAEAGVIGGAGTILVRASKMLEGFRTGNLDQDAGIQVMQRALTVPFREIMRNGGKSDEVILQKVLENPSLTFGYDAANDKFTDLVESGIIDPVKVVISEVEHASSIAGLILSSDVVIAIEPEEKKPA